MIKTTLPNRQAIAQIIQEYRIMAGTSDKQATLREFAGVLAEALQEAGSVQRIGGQGISHQTIKNWGDRRFLPDPFLLTRLALAANRDWRGDFARDLLAALAPDEYQPVTEIGRRALKTWKLNGGGNGTRK